MLVDRRTNLFIVIMSSYFIYMNYNIICCFIIYIVIMTNFRDRIQTLPDSEPKKKQASQESQDIVHEFTQLAVYIVTCPEDKFDSEWTSDKIENLCKRWINLPDPSEIIDMAEAMIESKMPNQVASTFIGNFLYRLLKSMWRFDDND